MTLLLFPIPPTHPTPFTPFLLMALDSLVIIAVYEQNINEYNLFSCVRMCDFWTYYFVLDKELGTSSLEDIRFQQSLVAHGSSLLVRSFGVYPFCVSVSIDIAIVQVLFRQPGGWGIMSEASL